jgi:hypothetical protein
VLVQIFAETETHVRTPCWIAGVSSYNNLAGAPSRGDVRRLLQLGFKDMSLEAGRCLLNICSCMVEKVGKVAAAASPKS